jgi:hypothetical protein
MRRLLPVILAAALLGGCATTTSAPAGADSSLIMGELTLDASGTGTAPNGAYGFLNTNVPENAAMILQNEGNGKIHELRTSIPGGFFVLANAEPGTYKLVELWAQLKGPNSYFTLTSSFFKGPTFEVAPGRIANLGVTHWTFTFDLTRSVSSNSFTFNTDFPGVAAALSRTDSRSAWAGRQSDQVTFSGETNATAAIFALPPRTSAFDRILLP